MTAKQRLEKYAKGQHDLACKDLGIGKSPDDPGPTLHEAVCELRDAASDLIAMTEQMMQQTCEWNAAVEKIIGRAPNTGIDIIWPGRAVLRMKHALNPILSTK